MKKILTIVFLLGAAVAGLGQYSPTSLTGWTVTTPVDTYHPHNLWEIINGAADAFVAFGFQELNTFEVQKDTLEYAVYIYNMGTPLNAFGMYRTENSPSDTAADIGIETQFSDYLTVMLKGSYYVKIETINGHTSRENCESLIIALADSLEGNDTLPEEISLLPKQNQVPNSVRFIKENFLGVSELSNCLYARYHSGKDEYRIFVMLPGNEKSAKKPADQLKGRWEMIDNLPFTAYRRTIPYTGPVGIVKKQEYLIGISGIKDENELVNRLSALVHNQD
jgi:hypothetical protein